MKRIKFNISPSAINCYYESPITFYYTYIAKEKPDSISYQIYGKMGSLIHNLLEHLPKNFDGVDELNTISKFNVIFDKENYINYKTLNGKPINKYKYLEALKNGFKILKNKYNLIKAEECILFPFVNNEKSEINFKGIIDVQATLKETGQYVIMDYKTSSSVSSGLDFKRQGLFYCWLVWKKYNILPKKTIFEYIKIDKVKEYEFSEKDLITFEKELLDFGNMILEKGFDINKYEIGNYKTPFNVYKQRISKEELRRENKKVKNTKYIDLFLEKHKLYFNRNENILPIALRKILDNKLSYYINGHEFSPKFQAKLWDGKKHVLRKNYLPFGLFNILNKFILDYNSHFKTYYVLRIIDLRNKNIMDQKFNSKFKNRKIKLRYYQKNAVNAVLNNKYNNIIIPGIINTATGSGKTIIATELIRQTNSRVLFVVNRNELAEQTKNVFQNSLYNEEDSIGLILEGKQILDKQITVAGIQSIVAILKRNDTSSLQLQRFLSSCNMVIWDEAQNVKNEGYYSFMMKYLINIKYFVSLTGTAYRNDEHSLLMYSLVGTPIYIKTAKELEKEGFLCPVEINFIKYKQPKINWDMTPDNFVDKYNNYIIHNENRNGLISNICSNNRNKKILILTNRVKHTKVIKELLDICQIESRIITGTTNKKNRKKWFKEFKNSTKENPLILIGSMKIFNAGIDIPDLDIIINAGAGKSEIDIIQSIGRVLRKHKGKEIGYYYDFIDNTSPFKEQSKLRIKYLRNENHKVNIINNKFYK